MLRWKGEKVKHWLDRAFQKGFIFCVWAFRLILCHLEMNWKKIIFEPKSRPKNPKILGGVFRGRTWAAKTGAQGAMGSLVEHLV